MPSTSSRRIAALAVGGLGLYLAGLGATSAALHSLRRGAVEAQRKLAHLGETHAPLPRDPVPAIELWRACEGKVAAGEASLYAGYLAHVEPKDLPAMPEPEGAPWLLDEALLTVRDPRDATAPVEFEHVDASRWSSPAILDVMRFELDPTEWASHVRRALSTQALLAKVKVLVAARYVQLTPPVVSAAGFSPPTGHFLARVIDVGSGATLCEGRGALAMTSSVSAGGSGETTAEAQAEAEERLPGMVNFVFTLAVAQAPLHELCAEGRFCEATGRVVAWPKDRPWKPDRR